MAAQRGMTPVLLGLEDMTGKRADGDAVEVVLENAMQVMQLGGDQTVALVTDDPTVMRKTRRQWEQKYPFVVVRDPQAMFCLLLTDTYVCRHLRVFYTSQILVSDIYVPIQP